VQSCISCKLYNNTTSPAARLSGPCATRSSATVPAPQRAAWYLRYAKQRPRCRSCKHTAAVVDDERVDDEGAHALFAGQPVSQPVSHSLSQSASRPVSNSAGKSLSSSISQPASSHLTTHAHACIPGAALASRISLSRKGKSGRKRLLKSTSAI